MTQPHIPITTWFSNLFLLYESLSNKTTLRQNVRIIGIKLSIRVKIKLKKIYGNEVRIKKFVKNKRMRVSKTGTATGMRVGIVS